MFEAIALFRVFGLRQSFEEVVPLYSAANFHSPSFIESWAFIAATLGIIRVCQALDVESSSTWRLTAAVHVAEFAYHAFNSIQTEQAFATQVGPPAVILGTVAVNAVWFSIAWLQSGRTGPTKTH